MYKTGMSVSLITCETLLQKIVHYSSKLI